MTISPRVRKQLFYRRATPGADAGLFRDLEETQRKTRSPTRPTASALFGSKRALLRVKDAWHLVDVADKLDRKVQALCRRDPREVNPVAEWKQIYEAWRINRDEFYDRGCGADWKGLKAKYAACSHCARGRTRSA
jgi:hypothetical protein